MDKLRRERGELKSFLPEGWERKTRESKAICRIRRVGSAEELLHFGEGLPLKEISAVAKESGISDISSSIVNQQNFACILSRVLL